MSLVALATEILPEGYTGSLQRDLASQTRGHSWSLFKVTLNGTNATQESCKVIEMPEGRFQQRTLVTPASSSTPVPLGTEKFPLALEKGTEGGYELLANELSYRGGPRQ